jgi:nucleoside-diphosphate-sugar epimerase
MGPVVGITQTTKRHSTLQALGVAAQLGSAADILQSDDTFLLAIPGHVAQAEAIAQLRQTPAPQRAVLISSTGYYGEGVEGVVSENSPPGEAERAQAIAATERAFQAWAGARGVVIRCGGLYRPGRGPISALAKRGTVPPKTAEALIPLMHYDDAAAATHAALSHPVVEPTYLAVTLPSPTRCEFYEAACQVLGLAAPTFSPNRDRQPVQYDIRRLQRDLLPQPIHPDWQEALLV